MTTNETGTGTQTLEVISAARKFNQWMFDAIAPFVKGKVLEIGSGIGNMSEFLLTVSEELFLTDYNDDYVNLLQSKYADTPRVKGITKLDLIDPSFDEKFLSHFNSFDTLIALNVIEHISDDHLAIANCTKLLRKGGVLIILVPAYQGLYNDMDVALGHYRRYTKTTLHKLLQTQVTVFKMKHFNFAGIFGWFISGRMYKNDAIAPGHMKLFNRLVPLFRLTDILLQGKSGLSVIGIGKK